MTARLIDTHLCGSIDDDSGDLMLKIKKSHLRREEWIVYNPDNFALHTHCRSRRAALVIKDNVNHRRMPKSKDIRLIQSNIRVTRDKRYIAQLEQRIEELKREKKEREQIGV